MSLVASLVALPGPASGTVVWTEPRLLDSRGMDVVLASNRVGDSVAVWTRSDDGAVPYASTRRGRASWSAPQPLPLPCNPSPGCHWSAGDHVAVVDGQGRATVAWVGFDTGPNGGFFGYPIYVTQHDPRTGWSAPRRLSAAAVAAPTLSVDRSGTVTAAWDELESPVMYEDGAEPAVLLVKTAFKPAAGEWSSPELIDEGTNPSITAAPDGTLTVVYARELSDSDGFEVLATTRSPGAGWTEGHRLSTAPTTAPTPQTVSDGEGRVTSAWSFCATEAAGTHCVIEAAAKQANGSWTETEIVDQQAPEAEGLGSLRLAVGGNGDVAAVWGVGRYGSTARAVRTARRTPSGGWESPSTIARAPGGGVANVAADGLGNLVASWTTYSDRRESTHAAYRPTGAAWQSPVVVGQVEGVSRAGGQARVVATGDDDFTAAFSGPQGAFFADRVDDTSPPTVRLTRPARVALTTTKVRVAWSAADTQAGVAGVAVRRKVARYDGGFGAWEVWKRDSAAGAATMSGRPGRTYCFAVRATDRAGNSSPWAKRRCAATPVDDRSTRATSGWRRVKDSKSYRGTVTVAREHGQRLVLPRAQGRMFKLVATTCPRCGTVELRLGKKTLRTISLRSAEVRPKRVIHVASFARVHRDRVVVRVVSSGKPVRIDGIVVGR
jgi:hypothetical protein